MREVEEEISLLQNKKERDRKEKEVEKREEERVGEEEKREGIEVRTKKKERGMCCSTPCYLCQAHVQAVLRPAMWIPGCR